MKPKRWMFFFVAMLLALVASGMSGRNRRLAFAAALGHDPTLLVLEEPTSGVDHLARSRLWDTIRLAADHGAGVLREFRPVAVAVVLLHRRQRLRRRVEALLLLPAEWHVRQDR